MQQVDREVKVDIRRRREHRRRAQVVTRALELLGPPALDALGLGLLELLKFGSGHPYLQSCHPLIRPATPIWMSPERGIGTIHGGLTRAKRPCDAQCQRLRDPPLEADRDRQ